MTGTEPHSRHAATPGSLLSKLLPLFAVVFGITALMMVAAELVGGTAKLRELVEQSGNWAPLVYVGLKILTYVIAPLSGASIELASGTLFGVWVGAALSVTGSTLGGCINYWIARTLGRVGVAKLAGKKGLAQVDATAHRVSNWRVLLGARVLLSPIYDLISYAAGLARFPFWQYVVITFFVGIPINIIFPLLGHLSATSRVVAYAILGTAALLFIGFTAAHFVHRRRKQKTGHRAGDNAGADERT